MPSGGDPVRGGVQAIDDRRGKLLPGAEEGTGPVQGVQGRDGGCIDGIAYKEIRWESSRGDMESDNRGHKGRTADVPHGLPVQGRPAELPG